MAIPDLIYCANSSRVFIQIAVDAGWKQGVRLPGVVYTDIAPLFFTDQNWKNPQREKYMAKLAELKPSVATVIDLERDDQYDEVMSWAEEASQFVDRVVVIPKAFGIIPRIPSRVGNADVVLGYSVPTKYAGTQVPVWEFGRRPVHLLGGSPRAQMYTAHYLNISSADSNYMNKMATEYCRFWVPGTATYSDSRWWPLLMDWNGGKRVNGENDPRDAFEMSCHNIMQAWVSFWN